MMAVKLDEYPNEAHVMVKPDAYLKMLKHVLLYGNENIESSVEVMGICYGKKEGTQLVVYDAVPISHGGAIEVDFSPQDYAAFAMADEQMSSKGYWAVGWYHSHPGLKAFFSKVDVKNHLGWQTDNNPDAFGIVFDHTYFSLGEVSLKYGFQAFRLDDHKKGMDSDYHDITAKVSVELPDDLSYYREIDKIIEAIQVKKPLISEAREEQEGEFGTWEEEPEEEEQAAPEKDPFEDIRKGWSDGTNSMTGLVMFPFLDQFQDFTSSAEAAALKGPQVMITALEEMRDSIGAGLSRIKSYFEKTLENEFQM